MAMDMKIIGFNLTKLSGDKNPDFLGKLEVKSNINLVSIEKEKLDLSKQDAVKVIFEFKIDYGTLGSVLLSGNLFLILDSKTNKEVLSGWKDKNLSNDIKVPILNIILQKASLKALQLEEELGLPPHISFPRLQSNESKK